MIYVVDDLRWQLKRAEEEIGEVGETLVLLRTIHQRTEDALKKHHRNLQNEAAALIHAIEKLEAPDA